jgi:uncharacterized protein (DUF1697 family)
MTCAGRFLAGCEQVRTYIQSGNVIFQSKEANKNALSRKIEKTLQNDLGLDTMVLIRTSDEFIKLTKQNPFKDVRAGADVKRYVAFLRERPRSAPKLPLTSPKEGLELFSIKNLEAFVISRQVKGRYGFPNNFVEKELGVSATTRNWNTVSKILALLSK